jgi:ribosomal protein S18 acetylase RimI-like enzyme
VSRAWLSDARLEDAAALYDLRVAVARKQTEDFGRGFWSSSGTIRGAALAIRNERVYVVRRGRRIVGSLQLQTKKPWAIDASHFTPCKRPLYLTGMAVAPNLQRKGIGRRMLVEAEAIAKAWPADAIRLDAFEGPGGAGGFYEKCGYQERGRVVYRYDPLIYYEQVL